MNEPKLPDAFVRALLAQDTQLDAATFDKQRRRILDRLVDAEKKEKRSRKVAIVISCALLFVLLALASSVVVTESFHRPEAWPDWVAPIIALLFILCPTAALLICSIYFFRYRRQLIQLQNQACEQALLALPLQIKELRQNLDELRSQLKASDKSKQGFTVMELLVVVAILGILTSLLFPTFTSAKSRARAASCKSNLSQMGRALVMYETDYNYLPGVGDVGTIQPKQFPWAIPSSNSWSSLLTPYLSANPVIFSCPEYNAPVFSGSVKAYSFGYNAGGSAEVFKHMELNLGLGYGKSNFIASTALKIPSEMVAIGDLQLPSSVWCNIITPQKTPIGSLLPIPRRHGGGAHMLFVDSHLEWKKQAAWTAENDFSRSRWNSDHQPHPETW